MVLRAEVVEARLDVLRDALGRLEPMLARGPGAVASDRDLQWLVERGVHVAAESILDVGGHLLSGAFAVQAPDYAAVLPELAARGVIPHELAERLDQLAGLRILLVHRYTSIDHARLVREVAASFPAFRHFAAMIHMWFAARPG